MHEEEEVEGYNNNKNNNKNKKEEKAADEPMPPWVILIHYLYLSTQIVYKKPMTDRECNDRIEC